jgi:uncharacterized membrane protein YqjE
VAQNRRHELISDLVSEPLPTEAEEAANPVDADQRYEVAVSALRDLTRDGTRFKLVAEENTEYGFRRNCLGLRPLAVAIALMVLFSSAVLILCVGHPQFLAAVVAALIGLCFWIAIVNSAWVLSAANRYAERLLETVESLARES